AVIDALDDAVDDIAHTVLVFGILAIALGLTYFLHDHLFGRLRSNAAIFERWQRIRNRVADLRSWMALARFVERDLVGWVFYVLNHQHMASKSQIAGFWFDLRMHVGFRPVAGTRRLCDRVFHRCNHDSTVDRFFTRDRIGDL